MEKNYFFHSGDNKAYKLETDAKGNSWIYYVQVNRFMNGAFIHARGRDAVLTFRTAELLMETLGALPSTEKKYISMLKDYFAIDKKVREEFIRTYKL